MARIGVFDPDPNVTQEIATFVLGHTITKFDNFQDAVSAGQNLSVDLIVTTTEDGCGPNLLSEMHAFHKSPHIPLVFILVLGKMSTKQKKEILELLQFAGASEVLFAVDDLERTAVFLNIIMYTVLLRHWLTGSFPRSFPFSEKYFANDRILRDTWIAKAAEIVGGWDILKAASTEWGVLNDEATVAQASEVLFDREMTTEQVRSQLRQYRDLSGYAEKDRISYLLRDIAQHAEQSLH